jgi:hypothetical protein
LIHNGSSPLYKKVIVSGNVIELYEAEKEPYISNSKDKNDDYDPFDFEKTKLEPLEDRTEKRRQQTVRDARNTTRRLALMNFNDNDKFITLTYKKNMRDIEQADKDFKNFIKRFKYKFDLKNFKYLAVREFQKRGAIHYHFICNWDIKLKTEDEIKNYERILGKDIWKHGFVDIKQMNNIDNVGAYIIKYMTKNVAVEFFKGKKIYLCSQGLDRPKIYKGIEAEQILKTYNLLQKKEVFTNDYDSEYLGKITYKEYNLKRL